MCTLALFVNVFDAYPLLVAANRDERYDRPAAAPALIAKHPKIIAGRDLRAGGTWLGINEHGLMVGILNRRPSEANVVDASLRSRGLLCLDLLARRNTTDAFEFLNHHQTKYNPFTLVCVDSARAGVAFNTNGKIAVRRLNDGIHVFSSAAVLDTHSGKADRAYQRFVDWAAQLTAQQQRSGEWLEGLKKLLSDHTTISESDPRDAICVHGPESGTVSSTIIRYAALAERFESYFCAGAPCENPFAPPLEMDRA
jgi:uncharacterized protein with NRDE domain